jgi:hypothetical protein
MGLLNRARNFVAGHGWHDSSAPAPAPESAAPAPGRGGLGGFWDRISGADRRREEAERARAATADRARQAEERSRQARQLVRRSPPQGKLQIFRAGRLMLAADVDNNQLLGICNRIAAFSPVAVDGVQLSLLLFPNLGAVGANATIAGREFVLMTDTARLDLTLSEPKSTKGARFELLITVATDVAALYGVLSPSHEVMVGTLVIKVIADFIRALTKPLRQGPDLGFNSPAVAAASGLSGYRVVSIGPIGGPNIFTPQNPR